jgi:hypothetical protein
VFSLHLQRAPLLPSHQQHEYMLPEHATLQLIGLPLLQEVLHEVEPVPPAEQTAPPPLDGSPESTLSTRLLCTPFFFESMVRPKMPSFATIECPENMRTFVSAESHSGSFSPAIASTSARSFAEE